MDEQERIVRELPGKMVHVEVDRPVGYRHGELIYPINYGYLPGVIAGDGEAQDAYILGVQEPVSAFDGRVIGVIRRKNDLEDKLVVAPDGMVFRPSEIAEAVRFQERYFDSAIDTFLYLRAHHGMCIAFFEGKGYDNAFTAHMADVIQVLQRNPLIQLTTQTDVICAKCPNNQNGVCDTAEKVLAYDRQVLAMSGLSEGMTLTYADFRKAVYESILVPGRREEICGDCQWSSICHFQDRKPAKM